MSNVSLEYAGCDYPITRPLIEQRVKPDGVDMSYLVLRSAEIWRRMIQDAEFEASELTIGSYLTMRAHGDDRFVGLPIFPSRVFMQGYVFIGSETGIEKPTDLAGKRIGIQHYQASSLLWVRAFLEHDYGVPPSAIHWVEGNLFVRGDQAPRPVIPMPPDIRISQAPDDKTLEEMLLNGDVDAMAVGLRPPSFIDGDPRVRRLFPNYAEVEREYYQRTGFFPILHVAVMRRDVYERHRWIANALLAAFEQATAQGWKRIQQMNETSMSLPWLPTYLEGITDLFGGIPFKHGFEANLPILEAMTQYLMEQGLSKQKLDPEELFARETLAVGTTGH